MNGRLISGEMFHGDMNKVLNIKHSNNNSKTKNSLKTSRDDQSNSLITHF